MSIFVKPPAQTTWAVLAMCRYASVCVMLHHPQSSHLEQGIHAVPSIGSARGHEQCPNKHGRTNNQGQRGSSAVRAGHGAIITAEAQPRGAAAIVAVVAAICEQSK